MGGPWKMDASLKALGGVSRYQLLQVLVINVGVWGAVFQLLDNIFIGRKVTWHQCAAPANSSLIPQHLQHVDWNSEHVTYGTCEITVSKDNHIDTYPCLFGYTYDYRKELSFRTEFDLVCSRALLADLLQTLVIMGQGCGAVMASCLSDRYGRKRVLVWSQVGLLVLGMSIGMAPSFLVLSLLKFAVGFVQQGVITGKATMSIELFPTDYRSLASLVMQIVWMMGSCSMALTAYLMQDYSWRCLQCFLSAVSLIAFLQMWYLDESLRWLVANGRKEEAVRVLERAARVNRQDPSAVLKTLYESEEFNEQNDDSSDEVRKRSRVTEEGWEVVEATEDAVPLLDTGSRRSVVTDTAVEQKQVRKLSVLDIFRHKRLCFNTAIICIAWFTAAFCAFSLYMMTSSLHGDRFLNFFLAALMKLPSSLLFYFISDRAGRKPIIRMFFILAGLGLMSSGFLRVFEDNPVLVVLSVVTALLGMMGATGVFGSMFFYTPELYPTNIRQQALGFASLTGRLGGMIGPFMMPLSDIVVWAPGVITGSLCFVIVFLFRFLPETQGRKLPQTLEDIDEWYSKETGAPVTAVSLCRLRPVRRCVRPVQRLCRSVYHWGVGSSRSLPTDTNNADV